MKSVFSLWGAIMGGGNLVMHAAGWMEGGLVGASRNSPSTATCCKCWRTSSSLSTRATDALGLDAIREVGPGGHFFGAGHTLERYATAFYAPMVSDWRNFQQWTAAGRPLAEHKANAIWKQALAEYQEPAIDPAIREELVAFVERRIREGGEKTDF